MRKDTLGPYDDEPDDEDDDEWKYPYFKITNIFFF